MNMHALLKHFICLTLRKVLRLKLTINIRLSAHFDLGENACTKLSCALEAFYMIFPKICVYNIEESTTPTTTLIAPVLLLKSHQDYSLGVKVFT